MDATEAAQALTEINKRQQQTLRQGSPHRVPAWFNFGSAAGLVLISASHDVAGWMGTAMALTAVVVMISLAFALERLTGVRLRLRAQRWTPMVLFGTAVLTTLIGVGTLLRLYDVPADGTIAGLAAALVWVVAMAPAQAAASTFRNPA
ncbi:hypothetical protein QLQ12_35095 [Actinoplanes sp. NEAU-A12]|uniref:Uncharacterized protein n=1 Tax=Actinoplanes sandaracinus TaxID=3045177 RepID=A0ABT6WVV2_9ACTN|nr:hypothetical protein [Actinoplanes sandaracinus]MDI6103855.1 hypothetical protein [Actinoplanes sandaracinus]